ncbi:cobalt-precorrin-7 (C(5))-methyltransferase [Deinococcus sp. S9]|uniref:cobalt-precorrin-7 (C(5))-methyltransferase n=1 Tax=Deinococcus sp. S9 TaxID=2545754 RepID=UPI001055F3CD|nr:cobalt-precorrin-7 (C(5))-methyltransferase [Deinococcus sp. S9]TDE85018.1 cobalt-precorrin-7 (C(5))-methyltransferase [Deinococcus sp. S9]
MIVCVGAGPGHLDFLTRRGAELVSNADVVAGFDAVVDVVRPLLLADQQVVTMGYRDQVAKLAEVAALHHAGKNCVVVFMGDIHFSGFQFLERVERACGHPVETVPGISSAQLLASRGRVCFDETTFLTFHRRGDLTPFKTHLRDVLRAGRNAIVIPRPWDFMPGDVAAYLLAHGTNPAHRAEVWENLSRDEAAWRGTLGDLEGRAFSDMSILLIRALTPLPTGLEGEA